MRSIPLAATCVNSFASLTIIVDPYGLPSCYRACERPPVSSDFGRFSSQAPRVPSQTIQPRRRFERRCRPGSRRAWLDTTDDSHAGYPRRHQDASSRRGQTMSVVTEGQSVQIRPVAVMQVDRLTQTASPGTSPHYVPTVLAGVSACVGVLSVSGADITSRAAAPGAYGLFWLGLALIFVPAAWRLCRGRWSPSNSVPLPAGSGAMRFSLSSHGSPLRVVRIVATSSNTTA